MTDDGSGGDTDFCTDDTGTGTYTPDNITLIKIGGNDQVNMSFMNETTGRLIDKINTSANIYSLVPHTNRSDSDIRMVINISGSSYNISVPCSLISQDAGGDDFDFCNDVTSSVGVPFTDVDDIYIYNATGTLTFNETKFNITSNATIDARVNLVFLQVLLDTIYLLRIDLGNDTIIRSGINESWILANQYPPTNRTDSDIIGVVGNDTIIRSGVNESWILDNQYPPTNVSDDDILSTVNGSDVNASGMTLARIGDSTFSTVQDLQNIYHSVGWVSGGNITANSSHINITAGTGLIRGVDNRTQTIFFFDWTGTTNILIPANTTRYLGIEYNAGNPQIVIKTLDNWDYQTEFPIGTVVREDTGIHILNNPQAIGDHATFMILRSYETMPFARDARNGGLVIGTKGKNVTMTSGTIWDRLNSFLLTAKDTSGSDTFDRYFRNSGGGFIVEQGVTEWNNSKYDDGSGSLASLANNRYSVQYFYIEMDDELVSVYGTAQYTSLGAAEEDPVPSTIPDRITKHGRLIARIIFQEGSTTASSVESLFPPVFDGAVVTDHGDLAGLADDDHDAYIPTATGAGDGNLTITGRQIFMNILDLAEHSNSVSNFITAAVAFLDNYFTRAEIINQDHQNGTQVNDSIAKHNVSQTSFTVSQIDLINTSDNIYSLTPHTNLTASASYTLTPHTNATGFLINGTDANFILLNVTTNLTIHAANIWWNGSGICIGAC